MGLIIHTYASSIFWIQRMAYERKLLQGKVIGWFVDQSDLEYKEEIFIMSYSSGSPT